MKSYICKKCENINKKFTGTRQKVRKHIREDHFIKHKLGENYYSIEI